MEAILKSGKVISGRLAETFAKRGIAKEMAGEKTEVKKPTKKAVKKPRKAKK